VLSYPIAWIVMPEEPLSLPSPMSQHVPST
jgi:hypothetical protein